MKKDALRRKFVELIKAILGRAIVRFSVDDQRSLRLVAQVTNRHRMLFGLMVFFGLLAAIFEGGTIAILGFAVSVLIGEPIISATEMPGPLGDYYRYLTDRFSKEGLFLLFVGFAIGAQVFKSVVLYLGQVTQTYLSVAMRRDLQGQVTNHVMALRYSDVMRLPAGTMLQVINLASIIQDVVDFVSELVKAVLMVFVFTGLLISLSPLLTVIVVAVVLIFWYAMKRMIDRLKRLSTRATEESLTLGRWMVEYLNAPKLLRALNATKYAGDLINQSRDKVLRAERDQEVIVAAVKPAIELIAILGAGVILVVGYLFSGGASAAIPVLFMSVLVVYRLKPSISIFNDVRIKLARLLPKMLVVENFLSTGEEISANQGAPFDRLRDEIIFDGVSFSYPGSDKNVISNISFSMRRGETVALVGQSGAGKTTIIDLLLGLYKPKRGMISVDGQDLSRLNVFDWRENIGVVDQDVYLLNTTIRENIRFGRVDSTDEMIEAAARAAHAHEFVVELESGYNTVIGDRGYKLSGGQRQRLSLARAILKNPDLLILDEATSALDSLSERLIQGSIRDMRNVRTILIVAHRLSTVETADNIVVLDKGEIVEQGCKTELVEQGGIFTQLWNIQTGVTVDKAG